MYVSHQALRILAHDRMTAAEQREADAQLGQIVAALSLSWRRFGKRTGALARALAPVGPDRQVFEK
jgi:hypothetical protein